MPGLTQQDVTPVIPQVEDEANGEQEDEGYQWGRWLTKPGNELKVLGKKFQDFDKGLIKFVNRMNGEDAEGRYGKQEAKVLPLVNPRLGAVRIYEKEDEPGVIKQGSPLAREPFQGVVEATANVGLAGVNLGQNIVEQVAAPIQGREPEPQDPEQTLLGRPLAGLKEASANFLDVPQRYELDPADRMFRDLSGEVAVSLALAWLIGRTPLNPMGSSTSFTGTKLKSLGGAAGPRQLINTKGPLGALLRTENAAKLRPFLRWSSALGVESMATTALVDNRESPYADPGDDQTRAALKSLIPQAGFDFALAGGLFGAAKGVEGLVGFGTNRLNRKASFGELINPDDLRYSSPDLFKSIARNKKSHNTVNEVGKARTWAEESGLQQRNGEGSYEFVPDEQPTQAVDSPKNPREVIDRMEASWDSSLPEVDVAIRGLDQMDDEALTAIANRPSDQPIAEALGEQLNRQQQMRQAQEQLRQVAEARSQQRGFRADVAEEAPAAPELEVAPEPEVAPEAPVMETPQAAIPEQEMFEAIDVPQLQQIAALDVNVGAELAKAGTSPTQATRRELIDAILRVRQKNAGAASPIQAPPSAMPAAERNEVKKQVIRQAINNGEVRPSATEAPEIPTATKKDIDDMTPFEALDEELRLKDEYQKLDNAKAERIINETREAEGYYQMSPEEQVANGKLDGWEESKPRADLEAAGRPITERNRNRVDGQGRLLAKWANSGRPPEQAVLASEQAAIKVVQDKGKLFDPQKVPGTDLEQAMNDMAMGKVTPATEAVRDAYMEFYGLKDKTPAAKPVAPKPPAPKPTPEFVMPQAYAKSKPTFGQAQLKFESDLDRAAYMLQSKTTGAKADKKREVLFAALEEKGISRREALDLGAEVKAAIQDGIEEVTGSRRAPQEKFTIQVPKSALASTSSPRLSDTGQVSSLDLPDLPERPSIPMEERVAKAVNLRVEQLETDLIGVAKQVFGDDLPYFKFRAGKKRTMTPKEWGGDGIGYSTQNAAYTYGGIQDLITINNLRNRPLPELRSSMFHESWHRIQRGYLKPKELKILDNVFAQRDLANWANMQGGANIKQVEVQAVAFQNYSALRDRGMTRMDLIREATIAELEKAFPGFKGWKKKLTVNAFTAIAEGWERIRGFSSRARNLIEGNGYQNVYDLFEEAYDGRLTKNRRFEEAARTIDEVLGMSDNQVQYLINTGKIEEVNASYDAAIERKKYFNKWRGKANTVLNSIDTEIAALKQLATQGGC